MAETIAFKKVSKKRPGRKRELSGSEEEESNDKDFNVEDFEKTKEIQKLRKKTAGTNIVSLALGKKVSNLEENIAEDPFNLRSGGLVDMKSMKDYKQVDDAFDVGTQFFKETHIRDEDDEMRKFIETEMDKLKGSKREKEEPENQPEEKYLSPEDAALLALPEHLRKSTFKKDQQMLSAQMLSGIPEVDLGIDAKIQNIERTERAKKALLEDCKKKGIDVTNNYPSNMATDFVQHDRYKIEGPTEIGREKEKSKESVTVSRPNTVNIYAQEEDLFLRNEKLRGKASDDVAVQKFKEAEKLHAMQNRKK